MASILVMWLWPIDFHYFFHPKLHLYELHYNLALLYSLKKMIKMFLAQVTMAKVNK